MKSFSIAATEECRSISPLAVLGLQEVLNLTPPYLLTDFDRGTVRGYVFDVDPQGFTKSQSTSRTEDVQHPVMLLLWCSNNRGHYIAYEGRVALASSPAACR